MTTVDTTAPSVASKQPEQPTNSEPKAAKNAVLIDVIETDKKMVKAYLEDAADSLKKALGAQKVHRLAVFRFIADTCKIDGQMRQQAWKQFATCPSSFGCNASALAQTLKIRVSEADDVEEEVEA